MNAIGTLSAAKKQRLVEQLAAVMNRVIAELAAIGRIDLVEPLHDASMMLKRIAPDIVCPSAFEELVAAAARLIRTARGAARRKRTGMTLH